MTASTEEQAIKLFPKPTGLEHLQLLCEHKQGLSPAALAAGKVSFDRLTILLIL